MLKAKTRYDIIQGDVTMNEFTYEEKDRKEQYEKYEWDNLWLEHADNLPHKRVLYIGDSISCRAGRAATALSEESILFDGFGTSKGLDNPYFQESIRLFARQEKRRNAVIFNNGLHGWHLEDDTEYRYYYEKMVKFIVDEFKNTPVFIALTTVTNNTERNSRIEMRNKVAGDIAEKYGLPVIDLFNPSLNSKELLSEDGVHFTTEGDKMLGDVIIKTLQKEVPDIML